MEESQEIDQYIKGIVRLLTRHDFKIHNAEVFYNEPNYFTDADDFINVNHSIIEIKVDKSSLLSESNRLTKLINRYGVDTKGITAGYHPTDDTCFINICDTYDYMFMSDEEVYRWHEDWWNQCRTCKFWNGDRVLMDDGPCDNEKSDLFQISTTSSGECPKWDSFDTEIAFKLLEENEMKYGKKEM